jgi:hypothetical protein
LWILSTCNGCNAIENIGAQMVRGVANTTLDVGCVGTPPMPPPRKVQSVLAVACPRNQLSFFS